MSTLPLEGLRVVVGEDPAQQYAGWLLSCLGSAITASPGAGLWSSGRAETSSFTPGPGNAWEQVDPANSYPPSEPIADWASSGAMTLTGRADGPPLVSSGRPATAARGALLAFELLSAMNGQRVSMPGHELLGERAALLGLSRRAPFSPSGTFRIIQAADGWVGLSLTRPADFYRLPALLEENVGALHWEQIVGWVSRKTASEVVGRAQLLGIAACSVREPAAAAEDEQAAARGQSFPFHPFVVDGVVARPGSSGTTKASFRRFVPLVVDFSSLWAGPLCAHLLRLAGARVIKVESWARPDGARVGNETFFDLLHAGTESVMIDFSDPAGRDALAALVRAADVVIEASRPRALSQLGLYPDNVLSAREGVTWVAITAYGRSGPWENHVGFGDDAAAAAGLVAIDPDDGTLAPSGDAIGDPLAGMHAAVAALASVIEGSSRLIDVAIRDVAGAALAEVPSWPRFSAAAHSVGGVWMVETATKRVPVAKPTARHPVGSAAPGGANTEAVLRELVP